MKDVLDAYAQRDVERARDGLGARRRARRARGFGLPRSADAHDGGSAQHLVLRASAVLLEEHRADRRSRHQHRRDGVLSGDRRERCPPSGRTGAQETDIDVDGLEASNEPGAQGDRPRRRVHVAAHSRRRGRSRISLCCSPTISRPRAMSPKASSGATKPSCGWPKTRPISSFSTGCCRAYRGWKSAGGLRAREPRARCR